jgi:hypothetical protein
LSGGGSGCLVAVLVMMCLSIGRWMDGYIDSDTVLAHAHIDGLIGQTDGYRDCILAMMRALRDDGRIDR